MDTKPDDRLVFPFCAIVGQEELKLALTLNVIDPKIGGVMVMGDRGTGKSTTVRALVDLLPEIRIIANDPFNSETSQTSISSKDYINVKTPMVDLPLGATEDRVCGTIDIEKALTQGVKAFEPGLLAKANRGILYVDEVNLLDDHLVDVLLDSAASGWNTVEREGISICHPAQFILIGSGNPEEGELRPQLLDRFGMFAQIGTIKDPESRVQIVNERTLFDKNPQEICHKYQKAQGTLRNHIDNARTNLQNVVLPEDLRLKISVGCSELDIDGLRGDIVISRAARAFAAFQGMMEVSPEAILMVAPLCLRHRLRKDPLATVDSGTKVRDCFMAIFA